MIVTVTPNIALDVTYTVDEVVLHSSMRVSEVRDRAGGKGINVARVLHQMSRATVALGFSGGIVGMAIEADLVSSALDHDLVAIQGCTRRSVGIVDRSTGDATVFNEQGPAVSEAECAALVSAVRARLSAAEILVISGSLPPQMGAGVLTQMIADARAAGVPTILDTSGPALLEAVSARPDVVKPNAAEILEVTGETDPIVGARSLIAGGAGAVVVSLGADGMCAVTPSGVWIAKPPFMIRGNPTGAGDAAVAGLAAGIESGWDWPETIAEAVALSAAAVAHPLAGSYDDPTYQQVRASVIVEEIDVA